MLIFKRKIYLQIFILFIICLFLCNVIYAQNENQIDFKTLEYVIKVINYNYVKDTPQIDLVNNAVKNINEYLRSLKINNYSAKEIAPDLSSLKQIEQLETDCQTVMKKYPKIKADLFYDFMIRNILKSLNDPYSVFLSPKEYKALSEQMEGGNFGGLGIYIEQDKKNNLLTIVEPIEGTPAWKAGLNKGDQILSIDGKDLKKLDVETIKNLLRGPVGSRVTLTVKLFKNKKIKKITLVRALIHIKSLSYKIIDDNIGYINLKVFGEYTNDELNEALNHFGNRNVEGYILDIRNNGGGYMITAFDACSKFLPTDSSMVKVSGKNMPEEEFSSRPNFRKLLPLVVLINEYSASASEITAGAIKCDKTGILVGAKTFGKASVQRLIPLYNGCALKLTVANYYTPDGKNINNVGISPDVEIAEKIENIDTKQDAQLKKAVEIISSEISKNKLSPTWSLNSCDIIRIKNLQDKFDWLQNKFGNEVEISKEIIIKTAEHFIDQTNIKSDFKTYFDLDSFFM